MNSVPLNPQDNNSTLKCCTSCNEKLPATAQFFSVKRGSKDGWSHYCKKCSNQKKKTFRDTHTGRVQQQKRASDERCIERVQRHKKAYYAGNKESLSRKQKANHEANRERDNQNCKDWYEGHKNTESFIQRRQSYQEANRERIAQLNRDRYYANREYILRRNIESKYGMAEGEWDALFIKQEGVCPICGEALDIYATGIEKVTVDHCHVTNAIRGLLHGRCNAGIGFLRDNPNNLLRAYSYLLNDLEKPQ